MKDILTSMCIVWQMVFIIYHLNALNNPNSPANLYSPENRALMQEIKKALVPDGVDVHMSGWLRWHQLEPYLWATGAAIITAFFF